MLLVCDKYLICKPVCDLNLCFVVASRPLIHNACQRWRVSLASIHITNHRIDFVKLDTPGPDNGSTNDWPMFSAYFTRILFTRLTHSLIDRPPLSTHVLDWWPPVRSTERDDWWSINAPIPPLLDGQVHLTINNSEGRWTMGYCLESLRISI